MPQNQSTRRPSSGTRRRTAAQPPKRQTREDGQRVVRRTTGRIRRPASSDQGRQPVRHRPSNGQRHASFDASPSSARRQPEGNRPRRVRPSGQPPRSGARRRPQTPTPRKKSHKKRWISLAVIIALLIAAAYVVLIWPVFVTVSPSRGISLKAATEASGKRIMNVAVFGIDSRSDVSGARSDSIMIVTSDNKHKKIKAASLMRDTYVQIPGHSYGKLNSAYAYGGPTLALKTINTNFDTAVTDYIVIDFNCTIAVVNAVGGVDVNLSADEVRVLNDYVDNINRTNNKNAKHVTGSGTKHLNGVQALAYSRIRYVGNGDFGRTQRQRTVMQKVLNKAKKMSLSKQYHLYKTIKPYIKTNMSNAKIFKFLFNIALVRNATLEQQQIPDANLLSLGYLQGQSYVFPTSLDENVQTLHKFIYEHAYSPSSRTQDISSHIDSVWQQ